MDGRGLKILDLAIRLIEAGGAYHELELGDVVEVVIDELHLIPRILDHGLDCPGCDLCHRPEPPADDVGATVQ